MSVLERHEDALRASLQAEYGLRLLPDAGGRTQPPRTPGEVADLVEWLPAGTALARAVGGMPALSTEAAMTRELEHTERLIAWASSGGRGAKPDPIPLPDPPGAKQQRTAATDAKALAWKRRQERIKNRTASA
ncbi:hypothetical protein [Microbacterium halotolerans]|uniref:hypothetical protein n=1 Tax=Microbacterium halotolerans TaxID=246613 RepID=UPI000E6AB9E5|nr:hypothetical protein [Microbacterium halotolerans]